MRRRKKSASSEESVCSGNLNVNDKRSLVGTGRWTVSREFIREKI